MAETGGEEARDEQQLFEKQRHLLRARPQEREHNSSLRSGRSYGRRGPQMPGLGLRDPAVLSPFSTLTPPKTNLREACGEKESESFSREET